MNGKRAVFAALGAIVISWQGHAAVVSSADVYARSEMTLYRFTGGSDGSAPYASVIADQNGNLFGTTIEGGGACTKKHGCGTVPFAAGTMERVLHRRW